ncbi:hypothetical protein SDC9_157867 [bioreactor metagenome]|uniref:Uncharacterized protein n=1 Tax=bioreactor metagenome TaxID=1076179 RepID=A0A645FAI5_9ZZZZ
MLDSVAQFGIDGAVALFVPIAFQLFPVFCFQLITGFHAGFQRRILPHQVLDFPFRAVDLPDSGQEARERVGEPPEQNHPDQNENAERKRQLAACRSDKRLEFRIHFASSLAG